MMERKDIEILRSGTGAKNSDNKVTTIDSDLLKSPD